MEENSLIPTVEIGNLADLLTECFSLHQSKSEAPEWAWLSNVYCTPLSTLWPPPPPFIPWWGLKHSVETLARFSDLKIGIRELFCSCRSQLRSNHLNTCIAKCCHINMISDYTCLVSWHVRWCCVTSMNYTSLTENGSIWNWDWVRSGVCFAANVVSSEKIQHLLFIFF